MQYDTIDGSIEVTDLTASKQVALNGKPVGTYWLNPLGRITALTPSNKRKVFPRDIQAEGWLIDTAKGRFK